MEFVLIWCGVWAEMIRLVGEDGAACGRIYRRVWADITLHVGRNVLVCGRKWCGLWEEMKLHVGKMELSLVVDGAVCGRACNYVWVEM